MGSANTFDRLLTSFRASTLGSRLIRESANRPIIIGDTDHLHSMNFTSKDSDLTA